MAFNKKELIISVQKCEDVKKNAWSLFSRLSTFVGRTFCTLTTYSRFVKASVPSQNKLYCLQITFVLGRHV